MARYSAGRKYGMFYRGFAPRRRQYTSVRASSGPAKTRTRRQARSRFSRLGRAAGYAGGAALVAGGLAQSLRMLENNYPELVVYLRSIGLVGVPLVRAALKYISDKGMYAGGRVMDLVQQGVARGRARWSAYKAPLYSYDGALGSTGFKRRRRALENPVVDMSDIPYSM